VGPAPEADVMMPAPGVVPASTAAPRASTRKMRARSLNHRSNPRLPRRRVLAVPPAGVVDQKRANLCRPFSRAQGDKRFDARRLVTSKT